MEKIKILIIDGSDFRNDLIEIIEEYRTILEIPIEYEAIPNSSVLAKDLKAFVKSKDLSDYDCIFCHLRWISENIESLENLKNSDWFKSILDFDKKIGVSNGSNFRTKAINLGLFKDKYCCCHSTAADRLKRSFNKYVELSKKKS